VEVRGTKLPFGTGTKNSEIFDIDPNEDDGTHPPLMLVVDVRAASLKLTVAAPVFCTVIRIELGVKPTAVI